MTEEKRNRIIAAVTVNAILLIVILAAVVIYQVVQITVVRRNKNDMLTEIEQLKQATEREQTSLDYWQSREGLEDLAYQYHFSYGR